MSREQLDWHLKHALGPHRNHMPSLGPVGIIGFGVFGRFMARQLSPYMSVLVFSATATADEVAAAGAQLHDFQTVAAQPVVIPSVPVQNLEGVLERLAADLMPGALVVDVSSVKTIPVELMVRLLPPHCEILATHPLFGPQSGARGISGLPMVVWPVRIAHERYRSVRRFLEITLNLDVQEISPEEHDKEMAYVQALTFFVGRALGEIHLPDTPLKTKTYEHLLEVMRVVESDTPELFLTIQTFNPYASRVRRAFIRELDDLEGGLELKE